LQRHPENAAVGHVGAQVVRHRLGVEVEQRQAGQAAESSFQVALSKSTARNQQVSSTSSG
jgi:hypothetical protein